MYFTSYFPTNDDDLKNSERYQKANVLEKTSNSLPSAVIENSITFTNTQETADAFNKYFVNSPSKQSQR